MPDVSKLSGSVDASEHQQRDAHLTAPAAGLFNSRLRGTKQIAKRLDREERMVAGP
jgi:hypothetical protein